MPDSLVLSQEELLKDHAYEQPQIEAGYRLHGGLSGGRYVSPRTLVRTPAVEQWASALTGTGGILIDVSRGILPTQTWPNYRQSKLLLKAGLDKNFWTSLTTTGVIEARGGALCRTAPPDFQSIVVDDLSATVTGHLGKGLLWAHGADEAGDPANKTVGAHDVMWFAVRDMVFEKDAYPMPEIASAVRREPERHMPPVPQEHENFIKFLMGVLVIEVRAESFFEHCCLLLRDPELFVDRRERAEHAAEIVERIRQDETIHVRYLQVFLSELRTFTFKVGEGRTIKGSTFIDPVWDRVRSAVQQERRQTAYADLQAEAELKLGTEKAKSLMAQFDALES
jgi:hypothetical protein